jgi:hypothetical protein
LPAVPRLRSLLLPSAAASALVVGLLAPSGSAAAATGPTVTIEAPATATGPITVTATGDVDPLENDTALTMSLIVNGVAYGAAKACVPAGNEQCPSSFSWDSSGLNGSFTLQTRLVTTVHPAGVDSTAVAVAAVNPQPTVTLTSPVAGAVAKGSLTVNAVGSVDLSQSDVPLSLQLLVDGVKYGLPQTCAVAVTTAKTCAGTFVVNQPTWSGQHTVQVTMTTSLTSASSSTVPYLVYTGLKATLAKVSTLRAGRSTAISGRVVAVNGDRPLAGALVKVTLSPAVGRKRTVTVRTGGTGHFSLATKISANTTVAASIAKTASTGSAYAVTRIAALAPISCKVSPTVVRGRFDAGTCTVAHLPGGTKVTLQYETHKRWHTLGAGTAAGASIPVSFTFNARGTYPMRLVLGANKVYAATHGAPFTVRVT